MTDLHITILAALISAAVSGTFLLWKQREPGRRAGAAVMALVVFFLAGIALNNAADLRETRCSNGVTEDCDIGIWP